MDTDQRANIVCDSIASRQHGSDTDFYIELLRFALELKEKNEEQFYVFKLGLWRFEGRKIEGANSYVFTPDYNAPEVVYLKWLLDNKTPFYAGFAYKKSVVTDSNNYSSLNDWERNFLNRINVLLTLIARLESKENKKRLIADAIVKLKKWHSKYKDTFSRAYVMQEQMERLENISVNVDSETPRTGLTPKAGLKPDHFKELYSYLVDERRKWIEVRENSERDFLAIFSTDTLPKGWQSIKWLRQTTQKKPHLEILFNILYLCCEDSKQSFLFAEKGFNYFAYEHDTRKFKKYTGSKMQGIKKILPK
jgi:hypothetical protein